MKSIHMITKLTLSIKSEVIAKAKVYAKANGTSVSKLVEDYLKNLSQPITDIEAQEWSPGLRALVGCVSLPEDVDYKEVYRAYLEEKYG